MSDLVVYTATFGGYDRLRRPVVVNRDVRYVAFVDHAVKSCDPWRLINFPVTSLTPARANRKHKLHPDFHFPCDQWSIYIDANCELRMDPQDIVSHCKSVCPGADIVVCRHPNARCAYEEGERVKHYRKANPGAVDCQMAAYRADGFPENLGLTCNRVLIRRHTPAVARLMAAWWSEIERHTHRDQLSLQYVCWKLGFTLGVLPAADMGMMVRVRRHGA